jgi:EAL domain-containing protein (putative c-di-GMP-specific phosphodiesterase class I)
MEGTKMSTLLWPALLLGYVAGIAAAIVLSPGSLTEPLGGALALAALIVAAGFGLLHLRRAVRRSREAEAAAPVASERAEGDFPGSLASGSRQVVAAAAGEPEDPRWPLRVRLEPPGALGPCELRRLLDEDRVDLGLRPLASLEQPDAALYHALPRLQALDGTPVAPAHYRASAARGGLLGLVDLRLVQRSAELLREAHAEDRQLMIVCGIAADSLRDPRFGAALDQWLSDHPALADRLVLALDHPMHELASVVAMAGLRGQGMRFCLRRVGPPALNPTEIQAHGFDFVLLEAARFALDHEGGEVEPSLVELQRTFGAAGPVLLVGRTGADRSTIALPGDWARSADDAAFDLARAHAA